MATTPILNAGTTNIVANRNYNPGTYTSPDAQLAVGLVGGSLTVDRSNWTAFDATCTLTAWISLDAGTTWTQLTQAIFQMGPATAPDGTPVPEVEIGIPSLPNPSQVGRLVRASFAITGNAKKTGLNITLF